jgi:hypothetical protein
MSRAASEPGEHNSVMNKEPAKFSTQEVAILDVQDELSAAARPSTMWIGEP